MAIIATCILIGFFVCIQVDEPGSRIKSLDDKEAIAGAWNRLNKDLSKRSEPIGPIQRFVGFVEGRLKISAPPYWDKAISNGKFKHDAIRFGPSAETPFPRAFRGATVTRGYNLAKTNGKWELVGPSLSIPLDSFDPDKCSLNIQDETIGCQEIAVANADNGSAVLGFCLDAPFEFTIAKIGKDGKVIWNERVKCRKPHDIVSVGSCFGNSTVEIVVTESTVYVFGVSNGVVYLETFDLKLGTAILRFSSH